MGSDPSKIRRIKDRIRIGKDNCLDCKGRDIGQALVCDDKKCFYWKQHEFWTKTLFPGCCD